MNFHDQIDWESAENFGIKSANGPSNLTVKIFEIFLNYLPLKSYLFWFSFSVPPTHSHFDSKLSKRCKIFEQSQLYRLQMVQFRCLKLRDIFILYLLEELPFPIMAFNQLISAMRLSYTCILLCPSILV